MAKPGRFTVVKLVGSEVTIQYTTDGAENIVKKLDHFSMGAKDFTSTFQEYDPIFMASIQNNFSQQGRPSKWKPLALATVLDRIRQGYNGTSPILVRSGALKRGFRSRIGRRSYAIYNRVPYYPYQQFGTPTIPARPMVVSLVGLRRNFTEIARRNLGLEE